jgi:hypothetical protein
MMVIKKKEGSELGTFTTTLPHTCVNSRMGQICVALCHKGKPNTAPYLNYQRNPRCQAIKKHGD